MRAWMILLAALCISPELCADEKIVIAHRGASGYLPEHTLESYALAYGMGADFIEPDLVLTKDGHFIALHDIHLEATTNVEEVFPDRAREDKRWYAADFTLEEIRQLSVHERLPKRFPAGASNFRVPTFIEVIELVQGLNKTTGGESGLYPELKAPDWHRRNDLPMEKAFLEVISRFGYNTPDARIFVQCFEAESLKQLRDLGCTAPMIQLSGEMLGAERLAEIAGYAQGIGPDKKLIEQDPELVSRAHAAGLKIHPYTVRRDMKPPKYETTRDELRALFFTRGVDGLFADFPDDAVAVRDAGPQQ